MKLLNILRAVTVINLLVASGFSVAGIIKPALILPLEVDPGKAYLILALYAGARTIPLTIAVIFSVFNQKLNLLFTLAVLAGVIQLFDGFIGFLQNDLSKVLGPFSIAFVQFIVVYLASKRKEDLIE
jgi:hypothetical protein